jgi:hypothetical protein
MRSDQRSRVRPSTSTFDSHYSRRRWIEPKQSAFLSPIPLHLVQSSPRLRAIGSRPERVRNMGISSCRQHQPSESASECPPPRVGDPHAGDLDRAHNALGPRGCEPRSPSGRPSDFFYQIAFTSGTNNPYGIRSWKCWITAVSVLGIEIASASPAAVLNSTT